MSEPKFTPGPWQAFPRVTRSVHHVHHGYFIDAAFGNNADNGYVIADLIVGRHEEANARLIAAAPELYTLLVDGIRDMATAERVQWKIRAVTILAKARGEQVPA